ncbi:MAG TPA: zinc-binding dehydrogenase [Bdellovibrionota bacterium]|nr:zinc-binding dehydrogenase [Bdellovibrionota bacterium]
MKAWQVAQHGGSEVLKRVELPKPEPGPLEARVRVEALGLNHLDLWVRKGVPGHKFPLPLVPGNDIAGVVDAFGPGGQEAAAADGLKPGSGVLLNPGLSCGRCEACLVGSDELCPRYGILGETRDGGAAEFVVVPVQNLISRPAGLSAAEAACLPIPFLTAWTMLTRKAALRPGETVLIHAGGSGVSVAAIQMAKLLGATVITTVGSDEKARKAEALGADHVINYRSQPMREAVKKILSAMGKRGCEVIVDHVGVETWGDSMKLLSRGGRLVTCGATSGADVSIDLKAVFFKCLSILGSTMGSKGEFLRVIELVRQGRLRPVLDSTFPMDELPAAMAKLERREAFGKVVLTCSSSVT